MVVYIITLLVLLQLGSCSVIPPLLYRIDVQQGNVVTHDMVKKLKPGMTKSQVRFVLGSPLIVDTFRDNRWDYVYLRQEKGELIEQQRLTIFFEEEKLTHIENHLLPSTISTEAESIKSDPRQEAARPEGGDN
ncbi:outer membrane protein assembly factor BamE [Nitrosomonas cryotolerans]|nr:outer membrane protein assembly factor BamE [Nitrosomonas cryotolerans]